jgi:hypothetical protein
MKKIIVAYATALLGCGGAFSADFNIDSGSEAADGIDAPSEKASQKETESGSSSDASRLNVESGVQEASAKVVDSGNAEASIDPIDSGYDAGTCVIDLSNIGLADFSVTFDVKTANPNGGWILDQQASCGVWTNYWNISVLGGSGTIGVSLCDATHLTTLQSVTAVDDGILHHVIVARTASKLSITIDGHLDNSGMGGPVAASLGSLGMLQLGVSVCGDPLVGTVSNVCLSSPAADQ